MAAARDRRRGVDGPGRGVLSAIVTPLVLEYRSDDPAVYALAVLPIYDAIARVMVHGAIGKPTSLPAMHSMALRAISGTNAGTRRRVLRIMPHGIYVGLKKSL